MSTTTRGSASVPWWKEPTKDQWYAYIAAWLGWTLDAFDFTVFLLIMAPIAQEFGVPLIEVTAIFTVTLIMRLGGATASGWLADRVGRRAPLMISILCIRSATSSRASHPLLCSCSLSGRCWASGWARNGQLVRRWLWNPGQHGRAGSCPVCCKGHGGWVSLYRPQPTACSTRRSKIGTRAMAGAVC